MDAQATYENRDEALLEHEVARLIDIDVAPGHHQLSSHVRGSGSGYGVFAYLNDYHFDVPAQSSFSLAPGEVRCISLVTDERGDSTTPIERRLTTSHVEERAP